MKKLKTQQMENIEGGDMSYGAGGVCGAALAGAMYGWSVGPAGFIAMGIVGGGACAFSMWAARHER